MTTHHNFFKSIRQRRPIQRQRRPDVSIRDLEQWHPNSVFKSLLDRMNWVSKLDISARAKRLTRLRGRAFYLAVTRTLAAQNAD